MSTFAEKKSIYEIFRSCRLCGAGGGYKMPIIQNVVDLDDTDIKLCEKIKECVQIEVCIDDKMPPLICELCIDKINDFYEFQKLCQLTNSGTRARLGLPPQNTSNPVEDCILGVTEALYDSNDVTATSRGRSNPATKPHSKPSRVHTQGERDIQSKTQIIEKESGPNRKDVKNSNNKSTGKKKPLSVKSGEAKSEPKISNKSRVRIKSESPPPPKRVTRNKVVDYGDDGRVDDDVDQSITLKKNNEKKIQQNTSLSPKVPPKKEVKKELKVDGLEKLNIQKKRPNTEPKVISSPVSSKKIKLTPPVQIKEKCSVSGQHRASKEVHCAVCTRALPSDAALGAHLLRAHSVSYTPAKLSCNACLEWFPTAEEATAHHKSHRAPDNLYKCTECTFEYDTLAEFNVHLEKFGCRNLVELPDEQCPECWNDFPTNTSLLAHACRGEAGRPGGKCKICGKLVPLLLDLIDHEDKCNRNKQILSKPVQVRVRRCDGLLLNKVGSRYDLSNVDSIYGLDSNCYYPFLCSEAFIKREPSVFDAMVNIHEDVRKQFENYTELELTENTDSLSKTIHINKNAKENRKNEISFDMIDTQTDFSQNIDSLIDSLDDKVEDGDEASVVNNLNVGGAVDGDFDEVKSKNDPIQGDGAIGDDSTSVDVDVKSDSQKDSTAEQNSPNYDAVIAKTDTEHDASVSVLDNNLLQSPPNPNTEKANHETPDKGILTPAPSENNKILNNANVTTSDNSMQNGKVEINANLKGSDDFIPVDKCGDGDEQSVNDLDEQNGD